MDWVETQTQLGRCPDDQEVWDWIRLRMREAGNDLVAEIESGYSFGFSIAGLNKLRSRPLPSDDISVLFKLPPDRVRCVDDGRAHLIASLKSLNLKSIKGPIWNFSIGTGVGWGFTDSHHKVRHPMDLWTFFDGMPWVVKEPYTGMNIWKACGSTYGFDQIIADNDGVVNDKVFKVFALRWKSYIETCILEYSTRRFPEKKWGTPAGIVFTGGHIDVYEDRLIKALRKLKLTVPVFKGPKSAGLLGAAWNTVTTLIDKSAKSTTEITEIFERE